MDLSQKELLEMFHSLSKADGHLNQALWEKGAMLCLKTDKENNTNPHMGRSELRRYLNNCVRSDSSRDVGLDLAIIDNWISKGVTNNILEPDDKIRLHTEIILSKALLMKGQREQILSDPQAQSNILKEIKGSSRLKDEEKERILKEIEFLERKKVMQNDNKLKSPLQRILGAKMALAVNKGIAPSKEVSSKVDDAKILTEARKIAKNKNLDPLTEKAKKFDKIRKNIINSAER